MLFLPHAGDDLPLMKQGVGAQPEGSSRRGAPGEHRLRQKRSSKASSVASIGLAYPPPMKTTVGMVRRQQRQTPTRCAAACLPDTDNFPSASASRPSTPAWKSRRSGSNPRHRSSLVRRLKVGVVTRPGLEHEVMIAHRFAERKVVAQCTDTVSTRGSSAKMLAVPSP